jgi:hypothetical protein
LGPVGIMNKYEWEAQYELKGLLTGFVEECARLLFMNVNESGTIRRINIRDMYIKFGRGCKRRRNLDYCTILWPLKEGRSTLVMSWDDLNGMWMGMLMRV